MSAFPVNPGTALRLPLTKDLCFPLIVRQDTMAQVAIEDLQDFP
jgi:hypothetical protein